MNNLDQAYLNLVDNIITNGRYKDARNGKTIAITTAEIKHNMQDGFPLLTTKKMFLRGIAVELEWFLRGRSDLKYLLDKDVHIWDGDAYKNFCDLTDKKMQENQIFGNLEYISQQTFIDRVKNDYLFEAKYGNLGPIYGYQWRRAGGFLITKDGEQHRISKIGFDQLQNAIEILKSDPYNRRNVVNSWAPNDLKYMALPPCHDSFKFYCEELTHEERCRVYGKEASNFVLNQSNVPTIGLSLIWRQRSVDTGLGLPFNIASYGLLLEIVAKQVNMLPLQLVGQLSDVHIYVNQIEALKKQILNESKQLPTLKLDDKVSINNFLYEMITLENYDPHATIKMILSN